MAFPETLVAFFYGSFMDERVRESHGFFARSAGIARLHGYDLRIDPLSRLVRSDDSSVYGVLCQATGADLQRLYTAEWMEHYQPHPVQVAHPNGSRSAAVCYIPAGPIAGAVAPPGYVESLVAVARRLGFPGWYVERIERYRRFTDQEAG